MGKEIIQPTFPRQELGKKILIAEKFARVGLASLAIAIPLFLEGCAKKSSPPPPASSISDRAPQFPTSNDRPLQNQESQKQPDPITRSDVMKNVFSREVFRKNPETLYIDLLRTPLRLELVYPDTIRGNSAVELDKTSRDLKAIGQVNIRLSDNDSRLNGIPNETISYTVFPNKQAAEDALSIILTNFPSPHLNAGIANHTVSVASQQTFGAYIGISVTNVENVLIAIAVLKTEDDKAKEQSLDLYNVAYQHFLDVAR